ncbi:MAG: heparinase II/III family protein [Acidobacteriota bacterium]|nr:heparinase II/III family protein [Acidobacteriota bacterium]
MSLRRGLRHDVRSIVRMRRILARAAIVTCAAVISFGCRGAGGRVQAGKTEGFVKHPAVFVTQEDVLRARDNIRRFPWAKQIAGAVVSQAEDWLKKDDEWLRSVVPGPDAAYAYGITACPICGADWGPWARTGASFENPGHVTCSNGHVLPDGDHPDPGTGYVGPDGRIHYFVGAYNAWVIETLTFGALENLVHAYSFTGDERYAAKAAVVFDAIAAIYPFSHKGPWDYPSRPPSGRLDRPWYQASRVLIHYVDMFDQLYNSRVLDEPSVWNGLTRRRNIEDNLIRDGGRYCYEQSKAGSLHNGEADYERGALAVGVCLGIDEYVRWTVDGPYGIRALLANNIDRDGGYYETTPMYADHTRELYFTFAEPLRNYRGPSFPQGLDLYAHPKYVQFLLLHNLPLHIAGHLPRYGDAPPDLVKRDIPRKPFDRSDVDFLEKLFNRVKDPAQKKEIGVFLNWLADGDVDRLRSLESAGDPEGRTIPEQRMSAGFSMYREPGAVLGGGFADRVWLVFHAGDAPAPGSRIPEEWERRLLKSDFLGQKGLALLRTGEGAESQGLLLRFGPSLNHGHYDDLNINYIARGCELTYDMGYGRTAASQTQSNWARQTVSHNVVVVDETSQIGSGETGGSLELFADTPDIKVVEASSEACYRQKGISVYRRLAALVGKGDAAYMVDLFRVRGGGQHDWVFHVRGETAEIRGVELGAAERGSLAGPDIHWSAEQLSDGDFKGHPLDWGWTAPPGNGYGLLANPRRGPAPAGWSADWTVDDDTRVRLTMAAQPGTQVITALANGLYPHYPKSRYVLARRSGENLASEFVAAVEPHGGRPLTARVERLPLESGDKRITPLAVRISRAGGETDLIYSSDDGDERSTTGFSAAGRFAHVRTKNGELESATLAGVKKLGIPGWSLTPRTDSWSGIVTEVDTGRSIVTGSTPLPDDGTLDGAVIVFGNPGYSRSTAYHIARVEKAGKGSRIHLRGTVVLGIGKVGAVTDGHVLTSVIPHEYANSVRRGNGSGFFQGKRVRTASGAAGRLKSAHYGIPMNLVLESTAGFKAGDELFYDDLQPGDGYEILNIVHLGRDGDRSYKLTSLTDVAVEGPPGIKINRRKS